MYGRAASLSRRCPNDVFEVDLLLPNTSSSSADPSGLFIGSPSTSSGRREPPELSFEARRKVGSWLPGPDWLLSLSTGTASADVLLVQVSLFLRLLRNSGGTGTLRCRVLVSLDFEDWTACHWFTRASSLRSLRRCPLRSLPLLFSGRSTS